MWQELSLLDKYWVGLLAVVSLMWLISFIFRKQLNRWAGIKDSGARRRNRRR